MIWSLIKLFTNVAIGAALSFTIVAFYIYDKDRQTLESSKETPFEDLYKDELKQLQIEEQSDINVDNIQFDYKCMDFPAPYGTVYMKIKDSIQNEYEFIKKPGTTEEENNKFKPIFIYYSKTSYIPYKYLDTLCRRYVIDYNVISLYNVNYNGYDADNETDDDNVKDEESDENNNESQSIVQNDVQNMSVFAKLKNKKTVIKKTIVKDINTFKYMGNLIDYEAMKQEKNDNKDDIKKDSKLSYKEFMASVRKSD